MTTKEETTIEAPEENEALEEEKTAAQDLDAALSAALEKKEESEDENGESEDAETEDSSEDAESEPEQEEETTFDPPPEWNKEEKEMFRSLDRKGQAAHLRVYEAGRNQYRKYISEADQARRQATAEYRHLQEMARVVDPFVKAAGLKAKDPYKAITEAVALTHLLNTNPKETIHQILRLKKIPIDSLTQPDAQPNSELQGLQSEVHSLKTELEASKSQQVRNTLAEVWENVVSEKNTTGTAKYPDLNDTDQGIALAQRTGSLLRSADFQRAVKARIPNATLRDFVIEAYRWNGGRIDDSAQSKSAAKTTPAQLNRARRASASVPGRAGRSTSGALKTKAKTLDEALEMALDDLELG